MTMQAFSFNIPESGIIGTGEGVYSVEIFMLVYFWDDVTSLSNLDRVRVVFAATATPLQIRNACSAAIRAWCQDKYGQNLTAGNIVIPAFDRG